jgi:hypothetical protein
MKVKISANGAKLKAQGRVKSQYWRITGGVKCVKFFSDQYRSLKEV